MLHSSRGSVLRSTTTRKCVFNNCSSSNFYRDKSYGLYFKHYVHTLKNEENQKESISKINFPPEISSENIKQKSKQNNAVFATQLGALANFGLASGKGVVGFSIGSTALIADAANGLGDLFTDLIVYLTIREARKKATPERPWGSGKLEPLGALVVGGLLFVTGGSVGYTALSAIFDILYTSNSTMGMFTASDPMAYAGLAVSGTSIFVKEALFRYTIKAGESANSAAVIANAWQHRGDALISGAVFIGVFGVMSGYRLLDPIAALLVSGIILKQGTRITLESVEDLRDATADPIETEALRTKCLSVAGVLEVKDFRARKSGPYLFVECVVVVPGLISASAAHRVAELVRTSLLKSNKGRVANAIVDIEPLGTGGLGEKAPLSARDHDKLTDSVIDILKIMPDIVAVKEVQVYYQDDGFILMEIGVTMSSKRTIQEATELAAKAKDLILKALPGVGDVDFDLELDTTSNGNSSSSAVV